MGPRKSARTLCKTMRTWTPNGKFESGGRRRTALHYRLLRSLCVWHSSEPWESSHDFHTTRSARSNASCARGSSRVEFPSHHRLSRVVRRDLARLTHPPNFPSGNSGNSSLRHVASERPWPGGEIHSIFSLPPRERFLYLPSLPTLPTIPTLLPITPFYVIFLHLGIGNRGSPR